MNVTQLWEQGGEGGREEGKGEDLLAGNRCEAGRHLTLNSLFTKVNGFSALSPGKDVMQIIDSSLFSLPQLCY